MNPEIYDENLKEDKYFDTNEKIKEPLEFTKDELYTKIVESLTIGIDKYLESLSVGTK